MSRLEHLRQEDLAQVDDSFVTYLFQLVEILSDDANDPYHYPIIRVLVRLLFLYIYISTPLSLSHFSSPSTSVPTLRSIIRCH